MQKESLAFQIAFYTGLTKRIQAAGFALGMGTPLVTKTYKGYLIKQIQCTMEMHEASYDVTYTDKDGKEGHCVEVLQFENDSVKEFIAQRFNVMVFTREVTGVAVIGYDGISVDGESVSLGATSGEYLMNPGARLFFDSRVVGNKV
jgi:hypothetical protein